MQTGASTGPVLGEKERDKSSWPASRQPHPNRRGAHRLRGRTAAQYMTPGKGADLQRRSEKPFISKRFGLGRT